jgi:hypothetical protein
LGEDHRPQVLWQTQKVNINTAGMLTIFNAFLVKRFFKCAKLQAYLCVILKQSDMIDPCDAGAWFMYSIDLSILNSVSQ